MAVSSSLYLPSKMNSAQPSVSCASKAYVGLRGQSPNCLGVGTLNLNVEFRSKVYRTIESRCSNSKATRSRFTMMPIGTPRVPYRNQVERTWQFIDVWNALYRERIIYLGKYIDDEFSNMILATMLYLDSIDNGKRLSLFLNGPGGDLTPSLAIYDTMKSMRSPIATLCISYASNLIGFILAAGEKGTRSIMPLSRVQFESPAGVARGQADDVNNEANQLVRTRDYLFKELAKNTGQPLDKIYKDLSVVKRFSAQEALEYGIVDRVLKPHSLKVDPPRKDSTAGLG